MNDGVILERKDNILVSCLFEVMDDSFSSREMQVSGTEGELREECNRICEVSSCTNNTKHQWSDYSLLDGQIVKLILKSPFPQLAIMIERCTDCFTIYHSESINTFECIRILVEWYVLQGDIDFDFEDIMSCTKIGPLDVIMLDHLKVFN